MRIRRYIGWNVNFCGAWTPIWPTFAEFQLDAPAYLEIHAQINIKHRGNYPVGVGWGIRAGVRSGATQQSVQVSASPGVNLPTWIRGAKDGGNILYDQAAPNVFQHYETAVLVGCGPEEPLPAGWHRVELWGVCHGASNGPVLSPSSSVVEVNPEHGSSDPFNSILYKLTPA